MHKRILILFAHPAPEHSVINARLKRMLSRHPAVTLTDLYSLYPDHHIDIEAEQKRLTEHDIVVFMHPIYWYSAPSILKEWQDLVLEYGWAFGAQGNNLVDKLFFQVISAGSTPEAYALQGKHRRGLLEYLTPFRGMAELCRMRWLPPYTILQAAEAPTNGELETAQAELEELIQALADDSLDLDAVCQLASLRGATAHRKQAAA